MRAAADDAAVLQHDDLVGVDDGRDPLGTTITVASRVTGLRAARSRASVARSSAENESSNR